MLIVILLLKLFAALAAIKNDLKVIGYYLLGNLGLDLITQIVKHFNHYPKPYTGLGFLLFGITTFCYLANGAWLLFSAGKAVQNKTIKQVSVLTLMSLYVLIMCMYPVLSGAKLLTVFYAYYMTLSSVSVIALIKDMRKHLSWSSGAMLMLSLGCIADLALVILFGFPYYWLVSLSNCMFYLVVLVVCWISPQYRHLLKP